MYSESLFCPKCNSKILKLKNGIKIIHACKNCGWRVELNSMGDKNASKKS